MNYAAIFQAPAEAMINFYTKDPVAAAAELIKRDAYKKIGVIQTELHGEEAAEEMFDLSNNPSRQEEREVKWGANRSLSVGDVVFVDDEAWLCCSMGWQKM